MTLIAQISDTHLMDVETGDVRAPKRIEWLRLCVQDINSLDRAPDAVIHTGDMSQHGSHAEYILAWDILADLNMPLYVTPGNRDSRTELRKMFSQDGYFQSGSEYLQYAVNVGSVYLLAIDSVCEGSRAGELCDERLVALEEMLNMAPYTPTALFMHHPPFDILKSEYPFQFGSRDVVAKFTGVLQRHPQIMQIFCGHAHRNFAYDLSNIRALTVPSIAVDLRLGDFPETMDDAPVYQIHIFHQGRGFLSETRSVT